MHKKGIAPLTLGLIIVALVGFVFISLISYSYLSSTESEDTSSDTPAISNPSRVTPLPTPNNSRGGAFTGGGSSSGGRSSSGGSGSGSSSSGSSGGGTPQCSDGIDNDGDGFTDYPADTGCSDASDADELGFGTGSNLPPSALFTLTPSSGSVPLSVTFNGSLSSDPEGLPLNYSWWWTNGTATLISTLNTSFSYVFTQAGTFTVNLTVTDNAGASSSNQTSLVVSAVCGDGIIHQGEQCDGSNLGGNTCPTAFPSAGYTGGTLSCTACSFVSTGCTSTAPDTTPPQFSGLITSPNVYMSGQPTFINVTVTDNFAVDRVTLTFNGQVYSNPTKNGNIYSQNVGQRAAGTYSYSWGANDTNNNLGTSGSQSYVLAQATPSLTVQSSSGSSFGYGTATTITVSGCPTSGAGGVMCRLYRNSFDVTSTIGQSVTLGAGAYTFTYNATGGQNYTSASQSIGITVSRAASSVSLSLLPSNSVVQGTQTTATGTCQSGLICTLTRNGISVTSPDVQTLAVGSYVYNYSTNGNTNYSASSQTQNLAVSSIPVFTLSVSKSGTGGGTVTSNVSGINCGAICSNNTIPQDNSILLTATPNASSTFAGWSGACSGTGTCQVTMSTSQSVTAQFNAVGAPLSIAFVAPTPSNGASQSSQSFTINVTSTDSLQHYSFVDFNQDLLFWMRMDDVGAGGNPTDLSSWSGNGTLGNGASIVAGGAFGNAASFDGVNDYIVGSRVVNTRNVTFSAWVKLSAFPTQNGLIVGFVNGLGGFVHDKDLYIDSTGRLRFYAWDGDYKTTSAPVSAIPLNQ